MLNCRHFWGKKMWKRTGEQPRHVAPGGFSNLTGSVIELPSENATSGNKLQTFHRLITSNLMGWMNRSAPSGTHRSRAEATH